MEMLVHAFTIGLILSIMPGPVFFVLIEKSITKGIRSALAIDLGVLVSDVVYILLAVLFVEQINGVLSGNNKEVFEIIGGSIFITYGIVNLFKKTKMHDGDQEFEDVTEKYQIKESADPNKNFGLLIAKGFLLNFANPMVIFYWLSVVSVAKRESHTTGNLFLIVFLVIVLATFFSIDVVKIFAAKRIRNLVTVGLLQTLNKLIGIIFIGFGLFFILQRFL